MVCDRRKIAIQYITTWFFPDLFSSMPYRHMFASLEQNPLFTQGKKALKMFRLLRLAKLARLLKMSKLVRLVRRPIQAFLDRCHIHIDSGKLEIYRLCALFFLIIHWVGCLNFMVVREYGFPDASWVVRAELEDQPTLKQYEWCLYKALAQMITIGLSESTSAPIVATTCLDVDQGFCAAEHWITLFSLLIGLGFQSVFISQVSSILVEMSLAKQRFREELRLVNEYMRMKALPPELRDRVREYYDLRFREGKMFDEKQILSKTSTPLRNEILQYNSRELKEIVPLLMNTPSELFKALSLHFEPGISAASDMIMHEGSDSTEQGICFILSGSAEMLAPQVKLKIGQRRNSTSDEHKAERIALIGDGCYFGDVATVLGCKRTASVRACTVLVCYSLDTNAISKIFETFPYCREYMFCIARRRYDRIKRLSVLIETAHASGNRDELKAALASRPFRDEEDAQTGWWASHHANTAPESHGGGKGKEAWHSAIRKASLMASAAGGFTASVAPLPASPKALGDRGQSLRELVNRDSKPAWRA